MLGNSGTAIRYRLGSHKPDESVRYRSVLPKRKKLVNAENV